MKKVWKIIGIVLVWLAIVGFFVGAALLRHHNEEARKVEVLRVEVVDSAEVPLVTANKITMAIQHAGLMPTGRPIDSVSLLAINNLVESDCFVRSSQTFLDYDGVLTVRLTQRKPIARVITTGGEDFYLTANGHLLPTQQGIAIDLPLVTGDITLPFPREFKGDMMAWAKDNKKNSDKNYIFLLKLTNFVRLVESRPEWGGNIVQIVAERKGTKEGSKAARTTIRLIPRRGSYTVLLGTLDDVEAKLNRWVRFVEAGVVDLNEPNTLDVSYEGQAVWRIEK